MSWSKTYTGNRGDVIGMAQKLCDELLNNAEGYPDAQKEGLKDEADAVVGALRGLGVPDTQELSVSAYGHVNSDGSGEMQIRIAHFVPVPVKEEKASEAKSSETVTEDDGN